MKAKARDQIGTFHNLIFSGSRQIHKGKRKVTVDRYGEDGRHRARRARNLPLFDRERCERYGWAHYGSESRGLGLAMLSLVFGEYDARSWLRKIWDRIVGADVVTQQDWNDYHMSGETLSAVLVNDFQTERVIDFGDEWSFRSEDFRAWLGRKGVVIYKGEVAILSGSVAAAGVVSVPEHPYKGLIRIQDEHFFSMIRGVNLI